MEPNRRDHRDAQRGADATGELHGARHRHRHRRTDFRVQGDRRGRAVRDQQLFGDCRVPGHRRRWGRQHSDAFPTNPAEWRDSDKDGIGDNADPDDNNNGILDGDENPNAPAAPVLISPVAEVVVDPMTVLKAGAFRSPVAGVTHVKSRWQIYREDDDACVLDVTSKYAKTSLNVPKFVLDEATQYFWRVQYIDSKSLASPWSEYGYFSTENTGRDANLNGIPDAQEVGATVDLDKDGVKDVVQTR